MDVAPPSPPAQADKAKHGKVVGIIHPPPDIRAICDKTAGFVAKNGRVFEAKIKAQHSNSVKFKFLQEDDPYHAYYLFKIEESKKADAAAAAAPPASAASASAASASSGASVSTGASLTKLAASRGGQAEGSGSFSTGTTGASGRTFPFSSLTGDPSSFCMICAALRPIARKSVNLRAKSRLLTRARHLAPPPPRLPPYRQCQASPASSP